MASNNADPLTAVDPETERRPIKAEPQELTKSIATTASTPPTSPPDFNNQLSQLRNLSTALSTFFRRYDELQSHLNFIKTSIDSKLPHNFNNNDQLTLIPLPERPTPPNPSVLEPEPEPTNVVNSEPVPEPEPEPEPETKPEPEPESEPKAKPNSQKPTRSELERLCESMCGRSVRKYVVAHFSEFSQLREEVSKALKFAPNPAKLVLDCIGRFYLQGSKAYANNESPLVGVRKASVLVLECFLLTGCDGLQIDNAVVGEAAEAAVAWRKRMISEGGVHRAVEIDARGLLFLISCFGIPSGFKSDDIRDLIIAARVRRISRRMAKALPQSTFLVPRIPEIIESMVKNKMEIEGADIAFTFGLEDKCSPQKILTTFLHRTTKSRSQGSSAEMKETMKQQLADLKSVVKCLQAQKVDPANLLPEWKITEKMTSLQKEIAELDKRAVERATVKRKAGESEPSKKINNEDMKRSRLTGHNVTRQVSAAGHVEGLSSYRGLPQTNSFLDRRVAVAGNAINGFSASPSILHGSGQSENIAGSVAAGAGLSIGLVQVNPHARVYGQGTAVNSIGQMVNHTDGRPYGYVGDTALNEILSSQAYAGLTYAPQHGDTARHERLVSQGFAGQAYALKPSSAGLMNLYRQSPSSLESFAGFPKPSTSASVWTRGSGSDLYQFADSVLESESYRTSGNRAAGGNVLPGRHSSYLY